MQVIHIFYCQAFLILIQSRSDRSFNKNKKICMSYDDEEINGFKMGVDDDEPLEPLDVPESGMDDLGVDDQDPDPDKDR